VTEFREIIRLKPRSDIEDAMLMSDRCTATHSVQTQAMRISSLHEVRVETLEKWEVSEILCDVHFKT